MTAMFMATLDNQIVSTALPTIVGEFGNLERFGWIGSAYLLSLSAVMPVYGKLGDLFGRKYVMMRQSPYSPLTRPYAVWLYR
jgi:MFS family permease